MPAIRNTVIPLLFALLSINLYGGYEPSSGGARSAGMGGAAAGLKGFWSLQNNQAGLAALDAFTVGTFYENRFLINELGFKSIGMALPTATGTFGLSLSQFGYTCYSENKIGLAYAREFTEDFSAGIQLDYLYTHIAEDFEAFGQLSFEIGLQYALNEKIIIGAHVFNPLDIDFIDEEQREEIPSVFKLGLVYYFNDNLLITTEAEKNTMYSLNLKTGIEYTALDFMELRMGVATDPVQFSFGTGFRIRKLKLDIASSYHQVLGFSPQISLVYSFKR